MYQLPASLLYANALNRYLINSPMLPGFKRDADGGLTLYVQRNSPGADKNPTGCRRRVDLFSRCCVCIGPSPMRLTANGRRRRCRK